MPKSVVRVVSAEIQRDGRYLLTQRLKTAVLPDLWEFPGGKVHEGETDAQALRAALAMRLGVEPEVGEKLLEVRHAYPDTDVVLAVYRCRCDGCEPTPKRVQALAWVHPNDFGAYDFPPADAQTVAALVADLD